MTQYGIYYDASRCTGCKTCELACLDKKNLPAELSLRNVYEYGAGSWKQDASSAWVNDTFTYYISIACNHCDKPACMASCAQGAIYKDDETGAVLVDDKKCIGCGSCAEACPYGAPKVNTEKQKSVKCDMCHDRITQGLQPICVEACPLRALEFGEIGELRAKYGDTAEVAPLPAASVTNPNIVIKPPVNAKAPGDTTGSILNPREIA